MRFLIAAVITTMTASALAETLYISDKLTVPLRSGPSNQHRILHSGLPSGTVLEKIVEDEEAGFTQIRTSRGTEGWIRTQYLVSQPIAEMRLTAALRQVARLEKKMQQQDSLSGNLSSERDQAARDNAALTRQVASLQGELQELKKISMGAIAEHANNKKLTQLNVRLRAEIDDLIAQRTKLQANSEQRWMLIGAGLLIAGLAIGLFVKSRPRRSGWS